MKKKREIEKIYSLSPMQEGMLFHAIMDNQSNAYFVQGVFTINGKIDHWVLEKSFQHLTRQYEALRTVFVYEKISKPKQVILKSIDTHIPLEDITHLDDPQKKQYLEEFLKKDRAKGFDLTREQLMRVTLIKTGERSYSLVWSNHHIIMDGWSRVIIINNFFHIYHALNEGKPVKLKPEIPYGNYIRWLEKQDKEEGLKYWEKYLEGYEQQAKLPKVDGSDREAKYIFGNYRLVLNESLTTPLRQIAKDYQVTINTILQTIWGILLQRYNNTDDVVFGAVVSGRDPEMGDIERMVGLFINTVPVRIRVKDVTNFSKLVVEIYQNEALLKSYQHLPLADIQSHTPLKHNLIDHILVFENYPLHGEEKTEGEGLVPEPLFGTAHVEVHDQTNYDLNLIINSSKKLAVGFGFNASVYPIDFIQQVAQQLKRILTQVAANADIDVRKTEILSREEKNRLLVDFNNTGTDYPADKTICQLFTEQVEKTPDNTALIGTNPKPRAPFGQINAFGGGHLTYKELNEKANQLAVVLRNKGVVGDTIVGIMIERSFDMIIGVLGILKAGGAYMPIDAECSEERINYMLIDANVKYLVKNSNKFSKYLPGEGMDAISIDDICLYYSSPEAFNACPKGTPSHLHLPPAPGTCLAYIIYTSGSTGKPKAVAVEHHSLVNRLTWMQKKYPLGESDMVLHKTPFTFDVSVWELLWWGMKGAKVCMLIPNGEKDPEIILETIHRYNVTIMHFVPSMLGVFLEYLSESSDIKKLSCLRQVISSGEALTLAQVKHFREILQKENSTKLANLYGPTEATIDVSYYNCFEQDRLGTLPIGKPIDNIALYILDRYLRLQPVGITGELFISGVGLARGYLNRPELTAEKFCLRRSGGSRMAHGALRIPTRKNFLSEGTRGLAPLLYRTGDLCRWLPDGNIAFLGRIDHQVKIRGFRIELGEIENRIKRFNKIKAAVAAVHEDERKDKYLCAYIVSNDKIEVSKLKEYLSRVLPWHMIPTYFIQTDKIPLTPNGKIDRKALPAPGIKAGKNYTSPRDEIERKLLAIWFAILGPGKNGTSPHASIRIDDNFFELGGHSLKAIILISKIHKELNVKIPLPQLFKHPTIRSLAVYIKASTGADQYESIKKAEQKEYYVLSSAQKRLHIIQQLNPMNISYNIPFIAQLEGELNRKTFEETFKKLISRHEILRTSIDMINHEPLQRIHETVEFEIESPAAALMNSFIRPFDLSQAPLLRVGLTRTGKQTHILMLDMHHIISDGVSIGVMAKEFMALYEKKALPELKIQYKDYAEWQSSTRREKVVKRQEAYWLKQFAGRIPVLNLPYDYQRPEIQGFEGGHIDFELDKEETRALKQLVLDENSTLFIIILAIYNLLLARITGQEDIIVGVPIEGRKHEELRQIIGMFVNTLAIRNYPVGEKFSGYFFQEVKKSALDAFENQDYPFDQLVEKLALKREENRNPLFDVMLIMQNYEIPTENIPEVEIPHLKLIPYNYQKRTSKFDLTMTCIERGDRLLSVVEYNTKLFREETIEIFIDLFRNIISSIPENPGNRLSEIAITSGQSEIGAQIPFDDDLENE